MGYFTRLHPLNQDRGGQRAAAILMNCAYLMFRSKTYDPRQRRGTRKSDRSKPVVFLVLTGET
jgi:hypothetical protein